MRKATAAAIGLLLVATACTSGGGGTSTSAPPNPVVNPGFRPRPGGGLSLFASTGLQAFDACDAFLDYVIDHALELVGPYGLFDYGYGWGPVLLEEAPAATAAGDGFANRSGTPVAGVDYSTTNVQEVGVDEPDIVKTDGNRIVAIAQGRL
ncbi:MAG: beta-propeller domain-containing protein, partial [Acidimicrobiia bacterium]